MNDEEEVIITVRLPPWVLRQLDASIKYGYVKDRDTAIVLGLEYVTGKWIYHEITK